MKVIGARRRVLTVLACMLAVGIVAPAASAAATWAEGQNGTGDAGQLIATAQRPTVPPISPSPVTVLSEITGTIGGTVGADMYRICKLSSSATEATTSITPGTLGDPQLFLFNSAGFGLVTNDDVVGSLQATLPALLGFGVYYLAISSFDSDPVSVGGEIFPDTFPGVFGPTGPGGGSALSDWNGAGATGTYRITLTGWHFCPSFLA